MAGVWGMQLAMRSARTRCPEEACGESVFLVDKEECMCTLSKMSEGKAAISLARHYHINTAPFLRGNASLELLLQHPPTPQISKH